jgi:hypothetical protein
MKPVEYEFYRLDGSTVRELISDASTIFARIKALGAVTAKAVERDDDERSPPDGDA